MDAFVGVGRVAGACQQQFGVGTGETSPPCIGVEKVVGAVQCAVRDIPAVAGLLGATDACDDFDVRGVFQLGYLLYI